jgi:hypothetical protein
VVDTVQVKAVTGSRRFESRLAEDLRKEPDKASRIIAFQVPTSATEIDKWRGRYWGSRIKADPEEWAKTAVRHLGKEILPAGTVPYRGPVYDPAKARRP